jgi:hypothetical protein
MSFENDLFDKALLYGCYSILLVSTLFLFFKFFKKRTDRVFGSAIVVPASIFLFSIFSSKIDQGTLMTWGKGTIVVEDDLYRVREASWITGFMDAGTIWTISTKRGLMEKLEHVVRTKDPDLDYHVRQHEVFFEPDNRLIIIREKHKPQPDTIRY